MATLPASMQTVANSALFSTIVAFIPGVPFCVLAFQRTEFAAHIAQMKRDVAASAATLTHQEPDALTTSEPTLWQVAILNKRKRELTALDALAASTRYASSPHVQLLGVIGFAVLHASDDLRFLEWLYTRFSIAQQRRISGVQFDALARCTNSDCLGVVQWLHTRNYAFPTSMMDTAAEHGNLELVCFLHQHSTSGCTTQAMDNAAASGHLDVVQFLHEHRSEGCTALAKTRALQNGHLNVLEFLHENRAESCSEMAVTVATINGHCECVRYAVEHSFVDVGCRLLPYAVMYGHLEIVELLHSLENEGCSAAVLLRADRWGHADTVDFLCRHRPMKHAGAAIREALMYGQLRLTAKLAWGMHARHQYEYSE